MFKRALQTAGVVVGRLNKMIWGWAKSKLFMLPGTIIDYVREIGDASNSDVVMAPVQWMMRAFPEAPIGLHRDRGDGEEPEPVTKHEVLELLQRPNDYYTFRTLMQSTVLSYAVDGNAYWMIIRNNLGLPKELWWVPHTYIEPVEPAVPEESDEFITHYCYEVPGLGARLIDASEVIHFRFGNDPDNVRKGLSPLKSVFRELYTDSEAANWTAALLRNGAVPGLVVSPDADKPIPNHKVEDVKEYFEDEFTGDNRGKPHVMRGPTKVTQFGFSPSDMNLRELRKLPEERVCALLGIPPVVAGLGAGLDRSTFSNMSEAREMAYESNIIPMQNVFAETLDEQLLPNYRVMDRRKKGKVRFFFDNSNVRVLQEDENEKAVRWKTRVESGCFTVAEARLAQGAKANKYDDVYLRSAGTMEVNINKPRPDMVEIMDRNREDRQNNGPPGKNGKNGNNGKNNKDKNQKIFEDSTDGKLMPDATEEYGGYLIPPQVFQKEFEKFLMESSEVWKREIPRVVERAIEEKFDGFTFDGGVPGLDQRDDQGEDGRNYEAPRTVVKNYITNVLPDADVSNQEDRSSGGEGGWSEVPSGLDETGDGLSPDGEVKKEEETVEDQEQSPEDVAELLNETDEVLEQEIISEENTDGYREGSSENREDDEQEEPESSEVDEDDDEDVTDQHPEDEEDGVAPVESEEEGNIQVSGGDGSDLDNDDKPESDNVGGISDEEAGRPDRDTGGDVSVEDED